MANPVDAPNRYERRRQRSRAALLEAAIELFQQQGVRATKLEEICERADVSARTFFNHFESREHLYQEIAQQRAEQLAAVFEARSDRAEPFDETLVELLAVIGAYLAARPAWKEMVREMLSLGIEGDAEGPRMLRDALRHFVERGAARGEVSRRHRPDVLADLLLGGVTTALTRWCADDAYDLEDGLADAARALVDLFTERRNEA